MYVYVCMCVIYMCVCMCGIYICVCACVDMWCVCVCVLCMYMYVCLCVWVQRHMCEGQRTTCGSWVFSTMWVLGIKLRPSDLVASYH